MIAESTHKDAAKLITERAERAQALVASRGHLIKALGGRRFEVPSCTLEGKRYEVRYGRWSQEHCDCPAFAYGWPRLGIPCKYLIAIGILHASRRSGIALKVISQAGESFGPGAKSRIKKRGVIRPLSEERKRQMLANLESLEGALV
jgi:hypothetical protein